MNRKPAKTHADIVAAEKDIQKWTKEHNKFLKELGLPLIAATGSLNDQ